ncbi:hypothetical protein F7725_024923, partial [Dissostichus mawsoni]
MDLIKLAVSFHFLLCSAWARHSYLDSILSPAHANNTYCMNLLNSGSFSVLRFLDEPLTFDPCCLMSPLPPPLFPPPPQLWKHGSPGGVSVLEPSVFGGEVKEKEKPVTPGCSAGPPGPPGPQGPEARPLYKTQCGLPGIRGPQGEKGEIGRPGSKGRTGAPGLPGKPGLQGWLGQEGPQGLPGYKGDKGGHGDPGASGPKGDTGSIGLPGMLGQKGEQGTKGGPGVAGKRGPTGRPGKRGKQVRKTRKKDAQGMKGHSGTPGVMGPQGPSGPNGHPGPPGPPASGLYLVGEKGEKGLPGPAGRCDCDSTVGANNAPFGSYTQRGGLNKVPAIFVVNNEEEMERLHLDDSIAFRRDQRVLYFKDKDGWKPIQPFQPFQSTEKVPDRVGVCGDGKVQAQHGEECDDGNQIVTDACLNCKWAYCGDGYRHDGIEECDGKDFGYQTANPISPGPLGGSDAPTLASLTPLVASISPELE